MSTNRQGCRFRRYMLCCCIFLAGGVVNCEVEECASYEWDWPVDVRSRYIYQTRFEVENQSVGFVRFLPYAIYAHALDPGTVSHQQLIPREDNDHRTIAPGVTAKFSLTLEQGGWVQSLLRTDNGAPAVHVASVRLCGLPEDLEFVNMLGAVEWKPVVGELIKGNLTSRRVNGLVNQPESAVLKTRIKNVRCNDGRRISAIRLNRPKKASFEPPRRIDFCAHNTEGFCSEFCEVSLTGIWTDGAVYIYSQGNTWLWESNGLPLNKDPTSKWATLGGDTEIWPVSDDCYNDSGSGLVKEEISALKREEVQHVTGIVAATAEVVGEIKTPACCTSGSNCPG